MEWGSLSLWKLFLSFCFDSGLNSSLIPISGWSLPRRDVVPQQLVWCWQINSSLSFSLGSIHC